MGKEKKEIGKLLELLNEFRPTVSCANFKEHYEFIDDDIYLIREGIDGEEEQFPMYICYKKGDFVKWLVENDKIDRDKELKENGLFRKYFYDLEYVKNYDRLVMWLSVEDEPINFLISILK